MSLPLPRLAARVALLVGFLSAWVLSDEIVHKTIVYKDVTILSVKDGQIRFRTAGGETSKPMAEIDRITVTDEPSLAMAETAFRAKQWDKAADAYRTTIDKTQKQWLRDWCSVRLLEASSKSGRFDVVIDGYLALLMKDPATAAAQTLSFPPPDSPHILAAIGKIKAAYNDRLTKEQKVSLLELRLKLHRHRSDAAGAEEAMQVLAAVNPEHPLVKEGALRRLLASLREALAAKQYDKVVETIKQDADKFATTELQAEALYVFAEARAGKAAAANLGPEVWKDVALDYMRVAASFPHDAPHVAESLLKAARIMEQQVKDPKTALQIYERVASEYRNQPAGRQAAEEVQRLKKA
jgi:tetratricopeptide (TPR) repeat protein